MTGYLKAILRDDPATPRKTPAGEGDGYESANEPVTISKVLTEAIEAYPYITREVNEKMRLRHRLEVIFEASLGNECIVLYIKMFAIFVSHSHRLCRKMKTNS